MKKIKFTCPHCEAKLRVPSHLAGVSAPCPKCGSTITAPSDITEAVAEAPSERRAANSAAAAVPQRVRQQSGGTAVLEAPVGQATLAPSQLPTSASLPVNPAAVAVEFRPSDTVTVAKLEATPTPSMGEQPPALSELPAPPALFLPPAPVSEPTPAFEDGHSAPPPLLSDEAGLVVEEEIYELPPAPEPVSPLAPITQPIRFSPPAGDLPMARENASVPGMLPRLDVSLAGQDLSGAAAASFGEGSPQHGRTRLVLPQPGTTVRAESPGDFLVSPAVPGPVLAATPLPLIPVPLTPPPALENVEFPQLEEPVDEFGGETGDGYGVAFDESFDESLMEPLATEDAFLPDEVASRFPTPPMQEEVEPLLLDDLEGGEVWDEDLIPKNYAIFDPEDYHGAPSIEDSYESYDSYESEETPIPLMPEVQGAPDGAEWEPPMPARPDSLMEPPFPEYWPGIEISPLPVPVGGLPPLAAHEDEIESPANSLHEGSFGRLFAQQANPDQEVPGPLDEAVMAPPFSGKEFHQPAPTEREDDILDELFASPKSVPGEKRGLSKTAIMAISSVVGVAVFSIIGVYFVINSFLGGLNPAEAYREPNDGAALSGTESQGTLAVKPKGVTVPSSAPRSGIVDAPAVIDPVAMLRDGSAPTEGGAGAPVPSDPPAVSFDEKVQQAVNGPRSAGASLIGSSPSLDLIDPPASDFSSGGSSTVPSSGATAPPGAGGATVAPRSLDSVTTKDPNYNPPASFAAPGPTDGALGKTHDLIDAFLRAPDWTSRINYVYQGESLRAAVEDYHKKWTYAPFGRYSLQLYQMETDTSLGGPYWVFIVSTNDEEEGFPLIVRTENGLLKVDWEIFAEFSDRHFLRFREGTMPPPATFRLIVERFSDYYGSDKDAFTDLKDHYVYQVNPPYGDRNEFSEFVFVKKDTPLAKKLDGLVRLGDEPLAVVVTLDNKAFAHGVKHFVITELLTEGWFR